MANIFDQASKAQIEGEIVSQTLDVLNSGQYSGKSKKKKKSYGDMQTAMSNTYDLSKSVLSAAYEAKGAIFGGKS